jgi:peptide/nickel transport system substrate-binding protein
MHPPFNNIKVRRALQMAINQEDYMRAVVGSDDKLWKVLPGFFTPGTPLYTEAGGDMLKKPDLAGAQKALKESGYDGTPVTCIVAQDQPALKAMGEITADILKKVGFAVDFVATDWGTVGQRRASKNEPGKGGWGMFHTWHAGADCATPVGNIGISAAGEKAWFGWPDNPAIVAELGKWYDAKTIDEEKAVIANVNRMSMEHVTYIPTGFYYGFQAWRSNLEGMSNGPLPWFAGLKKV